MEKIMSIDKNIEIKKMDNEFTIIFKNNSYALINSLIKTRIISGGSTDEEYKTIKFNATSVKTLIEYLDHSKESNGKNGLSIYDVSRMLTNLSVQLNHLIEKEYIAPIGYHINNIIVINDEKFCFLSDELNNIDIDEMMMISCPFTSNDLFLSNELLKIRELPSMVHFKSCYFSLALLIIYALFGDQEIYLEYLNHKTPEKILDSLHYHPIKNTKIFWVLSRCLVKEPTNRSIILI